MTFALRCLLALALISGCGSSADRESGELMVFAAASLRDVMLDQAAEFERLAGRRVAFNFAGSNVLALQLEASPGSADLFLSADRLWMDYLLEAEVAAPESRRDLLSNRLVVVAAHDSAIEVKRLSDVARPEVRFLALGNPEAVPAGRYARAALESVALDGGTLWDRIEERVAPAADVRGALALVEARSDALGIVYKTDAQSSARAKVVLEISEAATPPIAYSAALLRQSPRQEPAAAFLSYLESEPAGELFERHGFTRTPGVGLDQSDG